MTEGTNYLDIANRFIDQPHLLTSGLGLQAEHGIGTLGDEIGHQQRQGCNADNHQRNSPMDRQHDQQCANNGHNSGKQLGKAHEQTVSKGVHVRNHAADDIALTVLIQIRKRQRLDMGECLIADIAGDLIGHAVIDFIHHPLR